jgi:hypothetical protein
MTGRSILYQKVVPCTPISTPTSGRRRQLSKKQQKQQQQQTRQSQSEKSKASSSKTKMDSHKRKAKAAVISPSSFLTALESIFRAEKDELNASAGITPYHIQVCPFPEFPFFFLTNTVKHSGT